MKEFTEPSGHPILEKIMGTIVHFDVAITNKDMPVISALYRKIAQLYKEVIPCIENNEKLSAACSEVATGCEEMAEKLAAKGAVLRVMDIFVKKAAHLLVTAMK